MKVSLVAAVAENGVIGDAGRVPWRLPADQAHFRRLTTGHTVIMGRRTFESIGRPLPRRRNIVVSRNPAWRAEGAETARSLDAALEAARGDDDEWVFVVGGTELYREALPRADRLDLTRVHASVPGDTRFPEVDLGESGEGKDWKLVRDERHEADARHEHAFSIRRYERRRPPRPTPAHGA